MDKYLEQIDKRFDDLQAVVRQTHAELKVLRWMWGTTIVLQIGTLVKLFMS